MYRSIDQIFSIKLYTEFTKNVEYQQNISKRTRAPI